MLRNKLDQVLMQKKCFVSLFWLFFLKHLILPAERRGFSKKKKKKKKKKEKQWTKFWLKKRLFLDQVLTIYIYIYFFFYFFRKLCWPPQKLSRLVAATKTPQNQKKHTHTSTTEFFAPRLQFFSAKKLYSLEQGGVWFFPSSSSER